MAYGYRTSSHVESFDSQNSSIIWFFDDSGVYFTPTQISLKQAKQLMRDAVLSLREFGQ